ncbi:hypothetical protein Hanom_Chr12g01177221 [Helianthus anomalus]
MYMDMKGDKHMSLLNKGSLMNEVILSAGTLGSRAVNEPNVQRTVCEPFGGKFVYVRSISLTNEHEQKISFDKLNERTRTKVSFVRLRS